MSIVSDIESGEGKQLEFKENFPSSDTLAKTIVAFANTGGGKLLIGVDDQGVIKGISPDQDIFDLQDKAASIIYDTCYPNILPDIYTTNLQGKILLVIEVYRGNLLPYFLKRSGKSDGVFIRIGATNRKASAENIIELGRQQLNISYNQEIHRGIDYKDLDISSLSSRFARSQKSLDLAILKNLKLIQEENGKVYPTHGLLILLGKLDHVQIKCSRFKGTTMEVFLDRKEYSGDLFSQLENAENFIKNHINLSSEIKGLQREDRYEIPLEAIRESLINAIVHRDYVNEGRDIKIGVYDDVVNIVSPGGFPGTITHEDVLEGRSEIRNKVVARVFKELGYIEQWGSGIRRTISSCQARGLKTPEITEKNDFVDVCLYRTLATPTVEYFSKAHEDKVLGYMKLHDRNITSKEAGTILNLGDRQSRKILNQLANQGEIERVGKTNRAFYQLKSR